MTLDLHVDLTPLPTIWNHPKTEATTEQSTLPPTSTMSQPSLPTTIDATAVAVADPPDDASALTGATALDPKWLKPNPEMLELFKLEKNIKTRSPIWNFL